MTSLEERALALLFTEARTHNGWLDRPLDEDVLQRLYELLRMAPTAANCQPGRFMFVTSPKAKERLRPALDPGNVEKTMAAPATVIVAYDTDFRAHLSKLVPNAPGLVAAIAGMPKDDALQMAILSGTLQGAYLILAARGLGLDCGPMGGFDRAAVDAEFFPDGRWKSNFLVNLGHGDPQKLYPRAPRLAFDEACRIA